jgi:hypothetical protein
MAKKSKNKEIALEWKVAKITRERSINDANLKKLYAHLASDEFAAASYETAKKVGDEIVLLQDLVKLQTVQLARLEKDEAR